MKILLYCDWFKEYTVNLACSLSSLSNDVTIIMRESSSEFNLRREDEKELHQLLTKNKINFFLLKGKYSSIISIFDLVKIFKLKKKDGLHCFHIQQSSDPRFLWIALLTPTILTLHEPIQRIGVKRENGIFKRVISDFTENLYRRFSNIIIVHTKECLINLSKSEKKKAVVIPHGVSTIKNSKQINSNTILFFGRATEYKGIDTLLAAMQIVWLSKPEATLRILASPGDYRIEKQLDARIIASWNGYTNLELENELTNAKIVCMPYISATGSGVGAQAYGARKIIVATDLDGLRNLVSNQNYLVPPCDEKKLAQALIIALNDQANDQIINDNITWPFVGKNHMETYQNLIKFKIN